MAASLPLLQAHAARGPARQRRHRASLRRKSTTTRIHLEALEDRRLLTLELVGHWNGGQPLYSDGWAFDNLAFVGHYGNNTGVHILEVSDPSNPVEINRLPIGDIRDVEVQWQYYNDDWHLIGYFSSDIGNGLHIWEVTDPWNPVALARITSAQGGTNTVHTLSIEGDWLFEADSRTATVRVFDVSNPASPRFVRNIVSPIGDSVHEVTSQWGRLYTAGIWGQSSAEIWDTSRLGEPGAPVTYLGRIAGPALGAMAHTTWPTDDGNFIAVAREAAGGDLSFWDISNPATPQLAWRIGRPIAEAGSVHQVMIRGHLMFVSWYQAGIFVYDISDPYNPLEVGSYDTYPGGGCAGCYAGAWGIWGYWQEWDNRIYAFDMQSGVFIFTLNPGGSPGQVPATFEGSSARSVRGRANEALTLAELTPEQVAQLEGDTLTLTLTAADDRVTARRSADGRALEIVVNDTLRFSYDAAQVRRLNIRTLEGNDRIDLAPDLNVHLLIDAGPGEDIVEGWSESYVNPPGIHRGTTHAPKVVRYSTLGVETLVNSPVAAVNANPIDYSAHQLIEHAETTEGLTGLEGLAVDHSSADRSANLTLAGAVRAHSPAAALPADHLFGASTKPAYHKPYCY